MGAFEPSRGRHLSRERTPLTSLQVRRSGGSSGPTAGAESVVAAHVPLRDWGSLAAQGRPSWRLLSGHSTAAGMIRAGPRPLSW
ncbi:hypothetical protein ACFWXA_13925 [Streptomyces atroolivaceus]|uniref:hypothetical protein n=1 Tax=Streptomyces atroolivaceus TaxID=66869 RepID=UPI00365968AB